MQRGIFFFPFVLEHSFPQTASVLQWQPLPLSSNLLLRACLFLCCLLWLSVSPVWPSTTSPPSLPPIPSCAAILHCWVGGLRETDYGDPRYRMLIRPSAALPTIFAPRRELLSCYWFHYNRRALVTFLLSGGWSATLTATQGLGLIWHWRVNLRPANS